jgi:hypothetical protein
MEDFRDDVVADGVTHPAQLRGEAARRFRGPPQRRFWIAPRLRFDQAIQYVHQFRIGDFRFLATTSRRPDPIRGPFFGIVSELGYTTPNRRP